MKNNQKGMNNELPYFLKKSLKTILNAFPNGTLLEWLCEYNELYKYQKYSLAK